MYLKAGFCSIALHILPVDNYLNDTIPHLFTHIVPRKANQLQDCVHIPSKICSILLRENGNF